MQTDVIREQVIRSLRENSQLCLEAIERYTGAIVQATEAIWGCFRRGGKILLFGNGGSAADAQHIAAEFVGRFIRERIPLPAIALTTDTSILTAIANDYGFEQVFARQVEALGKPGDVAIAISTSGNSPNVLEGVRAANAQGLTSVGLAGGDGGRLAGIVDVSIVVPSTNTARIQECHITIGHLFCEIVERLLFAESARGNVRSSNVKVVEWDALLALREQWRAERKTVVWTNGCFDLLHVGHVRSLRMAKALGDVLVVGVDSDESVRQLKGPGRPIVPVHERVEVLASLESVDYVIVFDELTPEVALSRLKPDIHCKGADYAPPDGKPIPEASVVRSYGGRIKFLPLVPFASTSELIRRLREMS